MVLGAPIVVLIAAMILLADGRPVFFAQRRIGANGRRFDILKFRTMRRETPNVATHLLEDPDRYVLWIGRWLRKLSLDELPNLINVVRGDMVFVGPRPALFNQDDLIALRERCGVDRLIPGITGWAQVNGRDELTIAEKVALDREYLERRSLWFDLRIVVLTVVNVAASKGVRH